MAGFSEFRTDADIGNRALQHCGSPRMDATLGLQENSKAASEISFSYGKLRQAELRRNVWTFATRRTVLRAIDTGTMLVAPVLWVSTTTYFVGSIVADENSNYWISRIPNNRANQPLLSTAWEPYFGPLTVSLYDTTQSYSAGELVYTSAGDGTYKVFLSLQSANADNPATATAYDATAIYFKNQVVTYLSVAYMSLIDLNSANTPTASAAAWAAGTTYAAGAAVTGSDGARYTSVGSGNIGNDPTQTAPVSWTNTGILTPWTTVFVGGSGSDKWLQIGGAAFPSGVALTTLYIVYPVGAGPFNQPATRNVFRLPSGFLREAPQNPKSGIMPWLGGPSGKAYSDWIFENGYLVTNDTSPITFRFVADVTDVSQMDPMFCEGFAARIALEVCEPITQSNTQIQVIAKIYDKWITDARQVNAIEQGFEDSPDDDYVSVRY